MPVEQREQVTHVEVESTGNRMSSWPWWKPAGFVGWHEPDELRDSRPDLWGTRGENPRVYPADRRGVAGDAEGVREERRYPRARSAGSGADCHGSQSHH